MRSTGGNELVRENPQEADPRNRERSLTGVGRQKAMALRATIQQIPASAAHSDKSFLFVRSSVNWPTDHFFRPKAKEGL